MVSNFFFRCQGLPNKGLSLLDIQQQEAENAKKSQKEKPNTQTYTAKVRPIFQIVLLN